MFTMSKLVKPFWSSVGSWTTPQAHWFRHCQWLFLSVRCMHVRKTWREHEATVSTKGKNSQHSSFAILGPETKDFVKTWPNLTISHVHMRGTDELDGGLWRYCENVGRTPAATQQYMDSGAHLDLVSVMCTWPCVDHLNHDDVGGCISFWLISEPWSTMRSWDSLGTPWQNIRALLSLSFDKALITVTFHN